MLNTAWHDARQSAGELAVRRELDGGQQLLTCALEDIEDVMYIKLCQSIGQNRSGEVGVAVIVKVFASQQGVHIGIASGPKQIMHSAALAILAVVCQAIPSDGHHGSEKGQD